MINFQYYNPAKVVFGVGSEKEIGRLLKEEKASSLLMVYSGEFVKELGIFDTVKNACAENGIAFYENGNVVPNPQIELVREMIRMGKEKKVDFLLAVGGGSAVDTAKAVAMGIPYEGDAWDSFQSGVVPATVLPVRRLLTGRFFLAESGSWGMRMTELSLALLS